MPVHFEDDRLRIHKVVASPFANNAYVIVCRATGESIVVDAPRGGGQGPPGDRGHQGQVRPHHT